MDIYNKRKDFLKIENRVPFLNAILSYGSVVLSHQSLNDLNYLYFDALYLLLPLIHNSKPLSEYGYYYHENDIDQAVSQLELALNDHLKNLDFYKKKVNSLLNIYSPYNPKNIKLYSQLIDKILL